MNLLLKSSIATVLGLAMATTAGAVEPITTTPNDTAARIVAQTQLPPDSRLYSQFIANRRSLDEMIMMRMKMVGMAQEMLASTQDAGLKKLSQEMINSGNREITTMMEMRKNLFRPDID